MITSYTTIQNKSTGMYKEKGSRFLSFALPIYDDDEVKEIISQYKKNITMLAMFVMLIC